MEEKRIVLMTWKEYESFSRSHRGLAPPVEPKTTDTTENVCIAGLERAKSYFQLNKEELTLLCEFLNHQFISYEQPELIELVRRLGRAYNELATDVSKSA
jgi:hypothetical protein